MDFTQFGMINRYERICALPESELDRRWGVIRDVMRAHDVPVMVLFNVGESGMAWWLISCSSKLPSVIIFPLEGEPVAVYPPRGRVTDSFNDRPYPGRTKVEGGIHGRVRNTNSFRAENVRRYLTPGKPARIGAVHPQAMTQGVRKELLGGIPDAHLVDLTAQVARVRSQRSSFDLELARASAQMHRVFLEAVPSIARIGRTEKELKADLHRLAMDLGSGGEDMCLMLHVFDREGRILRQGPDQALPGRRLQEGDRFSILLETSGPGGLFSANLRYWSFGDISDSFAERYRVALGAQNLVQSLLRPGISIRCVADRVNDYIRAAGHYTDNCCYIHSMGYAMGDYPVLTDNSAHQPKLPEEDDPLQPWTILLAHSHVGFAPRTDRDDMARIIETYLVSDTGCERMTTAPREQVYIIR